MMPIEVRSKIEEMPLIRQFAERRLDFALDHLRNLRRISISIEDVNGPKGGADKHCLIVAELSARSVVLEETQPDWQSAVARAIHRLARKATQESQRVNRSGSHCAHRIRVKDLRKQAAADNDVSLKRTPESD